MRIGKTLLVGAVLLAVAFMAPAAAQAEELFWYDDDEGFFPTPEKQKEAKPFGPLTFKAGMPPTEFKAGPCEIFELVGFIYNSETMGEGVVNEIEFTGTEGCPTNRPECKLLGFQFEGLPWDVTLLTSAQVELSNLMITVQFSKGCEKSLIPSEVLVAGTPIGTHYFDLETEQSGVRFENSGTLMSEIGPIRLDGEFQFGTKITAINEI